MANYDSRLGEWFKLVEQQEQELKAKKHTDTSPRDQEPQAAAPQPVVEQMEVQAPPPQPIVEQMEIQAPVAQAPTAVIEMMDTEEIVADATVLGEAIPIEMPVEEAAVVDEKSDLSLFDDRDVPQVEDFFSFLNRTREPEPVEEEAPFEDPVDQGSLNLRNEGTGEPRPISDSPVSMPVIEEEQEFQLPPSRRLVPPPSIVEPQSVAPAAEPVVEPHIPEVPTASVQESWDRVPKHLQTLFGAAGEEVAQHSYKTFRETREGLIQRLLDPVISLEEAARILNVCPTTVRRYTNRGVLKHLRTAGNQRRFRLSDVLTFMEKSNGKAEETQ